MSYQNVTAHMVITMEWLQLSAAFINKLMMAGVKPLHDITFDLTCNCSEHEDAGDRFTSPSSYTERIVTEAKVNGTLIKDEDTLGWIGECLMDEIDEYDIDGDLQMRSAQRLAREARAEMMADSMMRERH